MLSGNGRHRRPRQAPALFVAAGVTGSAIAIPLLGASGASAADGTTWDRVAECESGGYWSQDSGNGYYGGLQVTQENWEQYGGTTYAPSADQASRSQQIAVAERILADQGLAAWPTCGPLSGLEVDSDAADVDTGIAEEESASPGNSGSSGSAGSSNSSSSSSSSDLLDSVDGGSVNESDSQGADNSTKSDKSTEEVESGDSMESTDPSNSSESDPSQEPEDDLTATPGRGNSDNSGQTESDSALIETETGAGTGRHRGEPADESAADAYVVRDGDSLVGIADSFEVDGGWRGLYAANKETIGADPDHIVPGQTLDLEGETVENQQ